MLGSCELIFEVFVGRRILPVTNAKIKIMKEDQTEKAILTTNASGKAEVTVNCTDTYIATICAENFIPVKITEIHLGSCKQAVIATMLFPMCARFRGTVLTERCRTCNICNLLDKEILELWQQDELYFQLGSRSSAVRITENRLNRIHKYYPVIPLIISVDNCFTKETQAAILAFQRTFDLAATGILDKVTYQTIAELADNIGFAEQIREDAISLPEAPTESIVKIGNQGDNVLQLQYLLKVAEIFYRLPECTVDGTFSEQTQTAVLAFQKTFLLPETGEITKVDWQALYEMFLGVCNIYPFIILPPTDGPKLGDEGYVITLLQSYLNAVASRFSTLPCTVNGIYDEATSMSVTAFCLFFGLSQRTLIDQDFWKKLFRVRFLL